MIYRIVVVVAALLGLVIAPPANAAEGMPFEGPFTSVGVLPPQCLSPVGICTHGLLYDDHGVLVATYDFTMETLVPRPDGEYDFAYTGVSVITKTVRPYGTMHSDDTGVLDLHVDRPTPFVTTVHLRPADGTGFYAGASGTIIAAGELTFQVGPPTAVGRYSGTIQPAGT
jgi:hypothetical protein